jgi:hypothetical protein
MQDEQIQSISALAEAQIKAEKDVERLEEELKNAKSFLEKIKCDMLPSAMRETGVEEFKLVDGSKVSIKESLRAYIKNENKDSVFAWLEANNEGSIIKAEIKAAFDRGQIENAKKLVTQLLTQGYDAELKRDIHWQTLGSFVKNRLGDGLEIPEGISYQTLTEAKVKLPT